MCDDKGGCTGHFNVLPVLSYPEARVVCCDADRVVFAMFSRKAGRLKCERHDSVEIPAGAAEQPAGLAAALRLLQRGIVRPEPVTVVLPSHLVFSRHLRIPRVNGRKRAKLVSFEAAQSIPCSLDEVVWSSVLSGENATTQEVLLAASRLAVVEPWCAALRVAGFAPRCIVPFPLALLAACRRSGAFKGEPELVLHLGSRAATLLLVTGERFAVRTWLLAGDVRAARLEAFTQQIAQETKRTVLHLRKQSDLPEPVRLLLVGDAGLLCDETVLTQSLKIPIQRIDFREQLEFVAGNEAVAKGPPCSWAGLLGAGAMALERGHPSINLLPHAQREIEARRRRLPWLIAAAVLMLAAPLGPLIHYQRLGRAAEGKLRDVEAAIAPLRMRDAANRARLAELEDLRRQIAAWQAVHERRSSWFAMLGDLQQRFEEVGDVWLDRMQLQPPMGGTPPKIAVSGRMLDRANPTTRFSSDVSVRMKALLRTLAESPHFSAVEGERFDNSQPGLLGFELVLVTEATRPL